MLTRIFTIFVVAMLALPFAGATPPVRGGTLFPDEATQPVRASLQIPDEAAPSLAAKRKKKKPTFITVTRTVRELVTRTFSNPGAITIPAIDNASPYPSAINVGGLVNGAITDVNLTLNTFSHTQPVDVDVLLVPAQLPGQNAIVMSDSGNGYAATNITLTLDDQAAAGLPDGTGAGPLVSGTFKPTNPGGAVDPFPGQMPSGNSLLSVFNGGNPNGSWQLFVVDDAAADSGQFAGGWTLQITA